MDAISFGEINFTHGIFDHDIINLPGGLAPDRSGGNGLLSRPGFKRSICNIDETDKD